jgi:ubiquinone/menaquinone biosynthesis C-methylase UbiE
MIEGRGREEGTAGEERYWDERYGKIDESRALMRSGTRYTERDRYLLSPLKSRGLEGKSVIEFGCGYAQFALALLRPADHGYTYIGTDVSLAGLRLAKSIMPEGEFVQCMADSPPFQHKSADVVLLLGVLHHIPEYKEALRKIVGLVKPGGCVLFDEAIGKPRIGGGFRHEAWTADEDSPHEGKVGLSEILEVFEEAGEVSYRVKMSPARVVVHRFLAQKILGFELSDEFIMRADQLWLRTFGRLMPSLGPNEAIGILNVKGP